METTAGGDLIATTQSGIAPFALFRPRTLHEAVSALSEAPAPAALYAGGTDIFAKFREGLRPASLICLAAVEALKAIRFTEDALVLGARLTHVEAAAAAETAMVPGLAEAWRKIATVRIRQQATLGGNLMARSTRYELPILFAALAAQAHLVGPAGERTVPVEALRRADLSGTPLLVSVSIPLAGGPRLDYERRMRPTFTQAACLRDGPGPTDAPRLRFVLATEWRAPWIADPPVAALPPAILAALPADYADPAVGNAYLRKAGAALLGRQLARLGAAR